MMLHPEWTKDRAKAFETVVRSPYGDRQELIQAYSAIPAVHQQWMAETVLRGCVPLVGGNAYIVPVFSEGFCRQITQWADDRVWAENEGELPDYRMEEIVVAHHDEDYDQYLKTVLMYGLAPFLACIYGKVPDAWNSVQLTRYSAANRQGGAYHVDATSKYTAVIALNTGEFDGGGTTMWNGVFAEQHVPALPTGCALIFRGREIFHKGAPVTRGTRKLLTIWADDYDCDLPHV